MLKNKVILSLYLIILLLYIIILFYISNGNYLDMNITYNNIFTYNTNTKGTSIYEIKEQNSMKCNLTTVNRIIDNMITKDYFYILKDNSNEKILDVIISNDIDMYRLFYNRYTRDFLCISNPFLKNYIPMTYILE
jgi:hypothetical protein